MSAISGCVAVRNAVRLDYPLAESVASYLPVCREVVIAYDPTSEDGTEELVRGMAADDSRIRLVASAWDLTNRSRGSEIAVQGNVAIEACREDWVLYIQADEGLHEDAHQRILSLIEDGGVAGAAFGRRSFLGVLEREIAEHRAGGLLRLFRRGTAAAVGDGMSCAFLPGIRGRVADLGYGLFNYSRMGEPGEASRRSRNLHRFYHESPEEIEAKVEAERRTGLRTEPFDLLAHPAAMRARYSSSCPAHAVMAERRVVSLGVLLGKGELQNIIPFLWRFVGWPGDIVVVDDMTDDGSVQILRQACAQLLGLVGDRVKTIRRSLGGDFAMARNVIHQEADAAWVLHADLDERWDTELVRRLPRLVEQLEREGKNACGFPRANYIDGVLVNDIPGTGWTGQRLHRALAEGTRWPPGNPDVHFCLLRKRERWLGKLHEAPSTCRTFPERLAVVRDYWILHHKSYERQKEQDRFYRSLGQTRGMPDNEPVTSGRSDGSAAGSPDRAPLTREERARRKGIGVVIEGGIGDALVSTTGLRWLQKAHPGHRFSVLLKATTPARAKGMRNVVETHPAIAECRAADDLAGALPAWRQSLDRVYNISACRFLTSHYRSKHPDLDCRLTEADEAVADDWSDEVGRPFVVVHPFGSRPEYNWSVERWRDFVDLLSKRFPIVAVGGPGEPDLPGVALDLRGESVRRTIALVRRAEAVAAARSFVAIVAMDSRRPTVNLTPPVNLEELRDYYYSPAYFEAGTACLVTTEAGPARVIELLDECIGAATTRRTSARVTDEGEQA